MVLLMTPTKAKIVIASNMKERRLNLNLTQAGLSKRSGVALSTLRKFEQSGAISLDNLLKIMLVVGGLNEIVEASIPGPHRFSSIEEVISSKTHLKRKRGTRS